MHDASRSPKWSDWVKHLKDAVDGVVDSEINGAYIGCVWPKRPKRTYRHAEWHIKMYIRLRGRMRREEMVCVVW
jgi:hypothetical protein